MISNNDKSIFLSKVLALKPTRVVALAEIFIVTI